MHPPDPTLAAAVDATQHATVTALSDRLHVLRHARGLTQAQAAHAAGITRNHYQLLEAGKGAGPSVLANPRLDTLIRLAEFYGVTVVDLLTPPDNH